MMFQRMLVLSFVFLAFTCTAFAVKGQVNSSLSVQDSRSWERLVWVTGDVSYVNHPTLGRTPAAGEVLAFRRIARNGPIVAVRANVNGSYELFLEPGIYRLIVPGLNQTKDDFVDLVAAGQSKVLRVNRKGSGVTFNIELTLPNKP